MSQTHFFCCKSSAAVLHKAVAHSIPPLKAIAIHSFFAATLAVCLSRSFVKVAARAQ